MNHGISGYPAEELGDGRYRARNLSMGMAGEWIVTVEVIRQGRSPASASFAVAVSEP
jgi:outer membrane biosynthesis protein TonB